MIAYDERKIDLFSRTPLFDKYITIPFQAIKRVKKDNSGSGKGVRQLVEIEYISDYEDTQEVQVYTGQIFNFLLGKISKEDMIFPRTLIK